MAALQASRRESSPSVAEIASPEGRELHRQGAGLKHEREVLCLLQGADAGDLGAVRPLIPFGYRSQSIEGHDLISRSRTIAKCCVNLPAAAERPDLDLPRWARRA